MESKDLHERNNLKGSDKQEKSASVIHSSRKPILRITGHFTIFHTLFHHNFL